MYGDYVTNKEKSAADLVVKERGVNCDYYLSDLKKLDDEVRLIRNSEAKNNKVSPALFGAAICALSGNPKACMTGVADGLDDDQNAVQKRRVERLKQQQDLQKEATEKMLRDQEIERKVREITGCSSYKCR